MRLRVSGWGGGCWLPPWVGLDQLLQLVLGVVCLKLRGWQCQILRTGMGACLAGV